jgi:hypothetical protein
MSVLIGAMRITSKINSSFGIGAVKSMLTW